MFLLLADRLRGSPNFGELETSKKCEFHFVKTRAFLQLANGIAKGMVVLRAGGNPKGGAEEGGREDESQKERERRGKTWSRRTESVAAGGGPWGERAWRGGGREQAGR